MKSNPFQFNTAKYFALLLAVAVSGVTTLHSSQTAHAASQPKAKPPGRASGTCKTQVDAAANAKAEQERDQLLTTVTAQSVLDDVLSRNGRENEKKGITFRSLERSLVKGLFAMKPGSSLSAGRFVQVFGQEAAGLLGDVKSISRIGQSEFQVVLTADQIALDTANGYLILSSPLTLSLVQKQGDNIHVSPGGASVRSVKFGVTALIQCFDVCFEDSEYWKDSLTVEAMIHGKTGPVNMEVRLDRFGNKADTTQTDMNLNAFNEAQEMDAALLVDVEAVRRCLKDAGASTMLRLFDASQTAWEKFRVSNAKFYEGGEASGTIAPLDYAEAFREATKIRVEELERLLSEGEGGTLPNPAPGQ